MLLKSVRRRLVAAAAMVAVAIVGWAGWTQSAGAEDRPVALELVLAIDVSASVYGAEYGLQRDGIAQAFRDSQVTEAIESLGPRGLAVSLVQWADRREQAIVVDWTWISDRESAWRFAEAVGRSQRRLGGNATSLSAALRFAALAIAENGFLGERRIIDISGNGRDNSGAPPSVARDQVTAEGITVNGLAILDRDRALGSYFAAYVIGGTAAFAVVAADFTDYARAIREKLLRELPSPAAALKGRRPSMTALLD